MDEYQFPIEFLDLAAFNSIERQDADGNVICKWQEFAILDNKILFASIMILPLNGDELMIQVLEKEIDMVSYTAINTQTGASRQLC